MTDFQTRRTVKARKDHRCAECGEAAIKAGDTYTRHFSACEGTAFAVKICLPCTALWDKAWTDHHDVLTFGDGVAWGDLREFLKEMEGQ